LVCAIDIATAAQASWGPPAALFFSQDRGEKRSAPRTDCQQASEKEYGVDTFPPLTRPVDVSKIEPQREFIERECGPDAVQDGHEPAGEHRAGGSSGVNLEDVAVPHAEQNQNAPDQVMDVAATHGDILEWPDVVLDRSNQEADGEESDEEADRGQEHSSARPVLDVLVEDEAELGEMEQQQHDCG